MRRECKPRQDALMRLVGTFKEMVLQSSVLCFEDRNIGEHRGERMHEGGVALPEAISLLSDSAIQGVIVPGNRNVTEVCLRLQQSGFDVKPIRSPTVPKGTERLRIILHCHNTEEEVKMLCSKLEQLVEEVYR